MNEQRAAGGAFSDVARPEPRAGEPDRISGAIEAILMTADKPQSAARIADVLGLSTPPDDDTPASDVRTVADPAEHIDRAIRTLNEEYAATGRTFRIEAVAGGYRIMTVPAMAPVLSAFHRARASTRLSRAAVETLAIVAYKQPITRAHLEAIRGVGCGEILRSLMERRLVTIKGRAEELGRPILYGTTREFLDVFGLASIKDLPTPTEMQGSA